MSLTFLRIFALDIDRVFARFEIVKDHDVTPEEQRRIRDMVVTHDPAACASEYGAFALMAIFPRKM